MACPAISNTRTIGDRRDEHVPDCDTGTHAVVTPPKSRNSGHSSHLTGSDGGSRLSRNSSRFEACSLRQRFRTRPARRALRSADCCSTFSILRRGQADRRHYPSRPTRLVSVISPLSPATSRCGKLRNTRSSSARTSRVGRARVHSGPIESRSGELSIDSSVTLRRSTLAPRSEGNATQSTSIGCLCTIRTRWHPVVKELSGALRAAVGIAARGATEDQETAVAYIEASAEWQRLDPADRETILAASGLSAVTLPAVSTDDELLKALDATPLAAWTERRQAIPAKVGAARAAVAKKLEPKSVTVTPAAATLRTEVEVDAYIAELRERLIQHVANGETIII